MATNFDELTENSLEVEKKPKARASKAKKTTTKKTTSKTKKTAKKVNKAEQVDNISQEEQLEPIVDTVVNVIANPEPEVTILPKRTIKNVKMPKKVEVKEVADAVVSTNAVPKKKRTLHLNLNFAKEPEPIITKPADTSINLNSSFFYEPSVFEKFNLSISDIDEIEETVKPIFSEQNILNTEINESPALEILESEATEIQELPTPEAIESEETTEVSETLDNIIPIEKSFTTSEFSMNSIKDYIEAKVDELFFHDEENLADNTSNFEVTNSIIEDLIGEISDEDAGEPITENSEIIESAISELTEAADNTKTIEQTSGEFFNSSIPSISNAVSTENKTYTRIKNINSPVFKKFTFDETKLNNAIPSTSNSGVLSSIVSNSLETANNINVSPVKTPIDNIIPEINVSADSTIAVQTPVTEPINIVTYDSSSEESDTEIIDYDNSNSLEHLPTLEDPDEIEDDVEDFSLDDINYDDIKLENTTPSESEDNDNSFSIESYFGLDHLTEDDFEEEEFETNNTEVSDVTITTPDEQTTEKPKGKHSDFSTITKMLENFNESINNLSDKISELESGNKPVYSTSPLDSNFRFENNITPTQEEPKTETQNESEIEINDTSFNNIDTTNENIEITDDDLMNLLLEDGSIITPEESVPENTVSEAETIEKNSEQSELVEDILSEALLSDDSYMDDDLKNSLLSEVLSTDDTVSLDEPEDISDEKMDSDFAKVLDCLTKAITELENGNNVVPNETVLSTEENSSSTTTSTPITTGTNLSGKTINILIDKDDIFSIQILNETYEIMADFDAISVISENLNISTPKNNFYVKIGEKYIEIHNNTTFFSVYTNFEDVEFANAINNVGFAKKNNRIELNIKEAFKLSSVNNKIELSMLNKTIASIKDVPVTQIDENSISDNKTLLISEETQKVYLPYTISEVMTKLKYNDDYKTLQDVIDNEYTVPLSTFKMPILSRFREAYRFMRTKENSSVYAAVDLAVELMFNSNLNPAVIRAAKDLKELNVYLDCLYENEVEKFDCFDIVYKVLPKIK